MQKPLKAIASLLFVVLVVIAGQAFQNRDYLKQKQSGEATVSVISAEEISWENWEDSSEGYKISQQDSQIYVDFIEPTTVQRVELIGQWELEDPLDPKIYYLKEQEQEFSENQVLIPTKKEKEDAIYINVQPPLNQVTKLRIDLLDTPGMRLQLQEIQIHHSLFQIWWLMLLFSFVAAVYLVILFNIPLKQYKKIPQYWGNFKRFGFLLENLVRKDIVVKYRRSVLGILWSVLNPLLMMLVITAVFQHLFRFDIENFPIYYLTGSLIYNFTVEATTSSMTSILESANLIKKVYIPKYLFVLEKCIFAFVNMLFSMIAVIIIYFVLRIVPPITVFLFPIPMIYTFVFSLGFGLILATMNVFFRDTSHLYSVWTTAWIYLTPIMYPIDILPPFVMQIVRLNPLYYYVEYFRDIMYYGVVPSLRENLICMFFSLAFLLAGILIFKKNQDKFILHI